MQYEMPSTDCSGLSVAVFRIFMVQMTLTTGANKGDPNESALKSSFSSNAEQTNCLNRSIEIDV